jgi:peptide subunit release factor 1 (eRF1)
MVTKADLATLQNYRSSMGRVLSIFLDVDQSKAANLNRAFETSLDDELRTLTRTVNEECESRDLEACAARARDFVTKYAPQARGLVVYSRSTGSLWARELGVPTRNQVRWGETPFVQPLIEALDEYQRCGVALVDRYRARIYTVLRGKIEKYSEVHAPASVSHAKSAGMDHLLSQSRFQRRADEHVHTHLKRVVELLETFILTAPFERLILAGPKEVTSELYHLLPKSLGSRVVGSTVLSSDAADEEVISRVENLEDRVERDYELTRVGKLLEDAGSGRKAVSTVSETLKSINEKRVRELIYAEGPPMAGRKCHICGSIFEASTNRCDYCGVPTDHIEDLIEAAANQALACGATIEQVRGEAGEVLMAAGGLTAFLRY